MARFAVTLFGADAPGIAAKITLALARQGYNLEDCSATTVRGHSAMVLMVLGPAEAEPALATLLDSVARNLNVEIHVTAASEATPPPGKRYAIALHGADRPGLISGVSEVFADHGVNVVDLKSSVVGEAEPLYLMRFKADIPDGAVEAVQAALIATTEKLGIQIASLDPVPTGQIAASVQIKDVRLQSSFFQLDNVVSDEDLGSYCTGYFAEVKALQEEQLAVAVGFQLVLRPPGEAHAAVTPATSLDSQPLKASALFHIDYSFRWGDSKPQPSDLQTFADVNAVFNSWPYWRQLVHSMLPSMGVHKLVIPVFRIPFPSGS
jgi:glycine cleavage system transcriptional repressor